MNDKDRVKIAIGVSAVIGMGIFFAMPTIHNKLEERAEKKAWEKEQRATIKNVQTRLVTLMEDPKTRFEDFWRVYDEEIKFLNIVKKSKEE